MQKLAEIVKTFKGEVLCIGVEDTSILKALSHNNQVNVFTLDRKISTGLFFKKKKVKTKSGKKVNMTKMRKSFKKKSIDYMVCDINSIYDYFKYFIYDSVVINKKKLYLYGYSKYLDPNTLAKRFERYHAKVEVSSQGNQFLLIIDNENSKGNWLKAKWYVLVDSFHNLGDLISTALTS